MTCALLVADGVKDEETFQVNFRGDGLLRGVLGANGSSRRAATSATRRSPYRMQRQIRRGRRCRQGLVTGRAYKESAR